MLAKSSRVFPISCVVLKILCIKIYLNSFKTKASNNSNRNALMQGSYQHEIDVLLDRALLT